MTISKFKIAQVLLEHPEGLKAKEIAKILGVEKKIVNSILYRYSESDFVMDENYIWKSRRDCYIAPSYSNPEVWIVPSPKSPVPELKKNTKNKESVEFKPKPEIKRRQEEKILSFNAVGCYYHTKAIDSITKRFDFTYGKPMYCPALLLPEPTDPHDPNAIQVMVYNDQTKALLHVGYVPKLKTGEFSRYVDSYATAVIRKVDGKYKVKLLVIPGKSKFDAPVQVLNKSNTQFITSMLKKKVDVVMQELRPLLMSF